MAAVRGTLIFILGCLAGAGGTAAFWHAKNSDTEVWVTKEQVASESGIVIPGGTKLVVARYMPEGFVALNLGINVEGEALKKFTKSVERRSFLRVPYFVYGSNE